jgi:hypothetical protein
VQRNEIVHEQVMLQEFERCRQTLFWDAGDGEGLLRCRGCEQIGTSAQLSQQHNKPVPRYTQSMDRAWTVLQKIAARYDEKAEFVDEVFYDFAEELFDASGNEIWPATRLLSDMAKWTPDSLCVIALKAIGVDIEER